MKQYIPELFISQDEYCGFFKGRPLIPPGEVWVFHQWNGEDHVRWGSEHREFKPPVAPFFKRHATQIYKLRASATYDETLDVLETTAYPATIYCSVTVRLFDPIAFIASGQYASNNLYELRAALIKALRVRVGDELTGRIRTMVIRNPRNLTPPPLEQLLSSSDLSPYVRSLHEFKVLGLDPQVIVHKIECPAYQQILELATIQPQKKLSESQGQLIEEITKLEIREMEDQYLEQLLETKIGYIKHILPETKELLLEITRGKRDVAKDSAQPGLARNLYDDDILRFIPPLDASSAFSAPGGTNAQLSSGQGSVRDAHIQQLYQFASTMSWKITPPQLGQGDFIWIDIGQDREVKLQIPKNYPQVDARVSTVKVQSMPIPTSQVKRAIPPNVPDLVSLLQALDSIIK